MTRYFAGVDIGSTMTKVAIIGDTLIATVIGGGARDSGLVEAIATELGLPLSVALNPRITAALGAALI